MQPDTLFTIANLVALAGWILLLLTLPLPALRRRGWWVTGLVIPAALGLLYATQIVGAWGGEGGFGSLAAIRTLFAGDGALLAGWLHYLAFDLFVGTWIVRDGLARGIPRPLTALALPVTFMLGPVGLLVHLATRPFVRVEA